jgi:hypothetical protein
MAYDQPSVAYGWPAAVGADRHPKKVGGSLGFLKCELKYFHDFHS